MSTETTAKKTTQKLQRAIVDGLEDVKAQDIQVFDSEHLSALFERVIVASGTSNRQTRALASSVCDAVRTAGFPKPRIEGEENGEWIIVDCGAAVVHIMQPAIRQYYTLEEIWGDKPVRLRLGAAKPAAKKTKTAASTPKPAAPKAASAKPASAKPSKTAATGSKSASTASATAAVKKTTTASTSKRASSASEKTSAAKTSKVKATTKTTASKATTIKAAAPNAATTKAVAAKAATTKAAAPKKTTTAKTTSKK